MWKVQDQFDNFFPWIFDLKTQNFWLFRNKNIFFDVFWWHFFYFFLFFFFLFLGFQQLDFQCNVLLLCHYCVMTSVPCQNYTKFSYFYVFRGPFFWRTWFLGCFSLFWLPWPLHIFFAILPIYSQYLDLIIRCAYLEQLMDAISHSFLEKSNKFNDEYDGYYFNIMFYFFVSQ